MDLEVYKKAANIQTEITRLENIKADLSSCCTISINYQGRVTDLTYDEEIRHEMIDAVKRKINCLTNEFESL